MVLSRSGQTTRGYDNTRVQSISHPETPDSQKATVVLRNYDQALTSLDFEAYTGVISYGINTGIARTAWAANTVYALDDIRVPVTANGYQYRCSVAGTSHAVTEPTWPTDLGVTVTDGSVTWEMDGNSGDEYSYTAPLKSMVQNFLSSRGVLTCSLSLIGILDQLAQDKAKAKYTQTSSDTNTLQTLITAIATASTGLNSAYNGYTAITVVYDSTDTPLTTFAPADYFTIDVGDTRLAKIQELLSYTTCKMRVEKDGKIHIFVPTTTGTTYNYEYEFNVSGSHTFFTKGLRLRFINPNEEIVSSHSDHFPQYSGTSTSATSYALLPKTNTTYRRLTSNAQAASIAAAKINKTELDDEKGLGIVPMNMGQEVWDYIKVTDSRENDSRVGNIQFLQRNVAIHSSKTPLTFSMTFTFGKPSIESMMLASISEAGATIPTEKILEWFKRLSDQMAEREFFENIFYLWILEATVPKWHITQQLIIPVV